MTDKEKIKILRLQIAQLRKTVVYLQCTLAAIYKKVPPELPNCVFEDVTDD